MQNTSETFIPNSSHTNVFMAISARIQTAKRIVQVNKSQLFKSDGRLKLLGGFFDSPLGSQIIACGKSMTGVKADPNPFGVRYAFDYVADVLERPAHAISSPSSILKKKHDATTGNLERLVDGVNYSSEPNPHTST
jgi:hypothetical protein